MDHDLEPFHICQFASYPRYCQRMVNPVSADQSSAPKSGTVLDHEVKVEIGFQRRADTLLYVLLRSIGYVINVRHN